MELLLQTAVRMTIGGEVRAPTRWWQLGCDNFFIKATSMRRSLITWNVYVVMINHPEPNDSSMHAFLYAWYKCIHACMCVCIHTHTHTHNWA